MALIFSDGISENIYLEKVEDMMKLFDTTFLSQYCSILPIFMRKNAQNMSIIALKYYKKY